MTEEKTTPPDDDLELIKRTLREIIENKSQGHDGHTRLEAIRLLHELIRS